MKIRDRIKELRRVPSDQLLPNPKNWRTHPTEQLDTLRGVLSEIGWADCCLVRETDEGLQLIDGHARLEISNGGDVPCLILDLTDEEADLLLATHDPLTSMASTDPDKLDELLFGMSSQNEAVQQMLVELAEQSARFTVGEAAFPELTDGDNEFCQMTFTVTKDQRDDIEQALGISKSQGVFPDNNPNANGNALHRIAVHFIN